MTLLTRPWMVDGVTIGAIYTFEKVGDVFPEHVHTEADNHITAVLFGSVKLTGHPKYEGTVVSATPGGTVINWIAGEPHGFIAETDGATIFNILKRYP